MRGVVLTREAVCAPARCTGGASCLYVREREASTATVSSGGESSQLVPVLKANINKTRSRGGLAAGAAAALEGLHIEAKSSWR